MEFRPCIDLHNGKVKQIVGSSLSDNNSKVVENFSTDKSPAEFAELSKRNSAYVRYYMKKLEQLKQVVKQP